LQRRAIDHGGRRLALRRDQPAWRASDKRLANAIEPPDLRIAALDAAAQLAAVSLQRIACGAPAHRRRAGA